MVQKASTGTRASTGTSVKSTTAAAPTAETASTEVAQVKKKRKKKSSRGLREVQRLEGGAARAADRLGEAVAAGLSTYRQRRNKSARKKRDGALSDFSTNAARGVEEMVTIAAKAPRDLLKQFRPKRILKSFPVPPPFNFFR